MNKKNDIQKQLKVINDRLDDLTTKWNKEHDRNMKELLSLSVLLQNLEDGHLEINKAILS